MTSDLGIDIECSECDQLPGSYERGLVAGLQRALALAKEARDGSGSAERIVTKLRQAVEAAELDVDDRGGAP